MEPTLPQKKIWFKAKEYGYGWYPASWQGWAILMLYLFLVLFSAWDILDGESGGVPGVKRFLVTVGLLTFFLLYICYYRGERLSWRWGKNDTHEEDKA